MPTFIARSGSFNNLRVSGSLSASGSVFLESLSTPPSAISNVLILSSSGQVFITASSALGGGGVTINPNVDDYLITATGTPNTLNGEPNLKFNGTTLSLTGSMIASGSVFFPALTTTNQSDVLTIDTSTGQLFYTASTAIGGGGSSLIFSDGNTVPASNYSNTTTLYATGSGISITQGSPGVVSMSVAGPGGGDRSVQFNNGGTAFGGDNNLRYDAAFNLILEDSSNPSLINLGSYSLIAGLQVTSSNAVCIVGGYGTTTTNGAQTVIGAFNTATPSTNVFVVGGGIDDSDRRDVLAVEADYFNANSPRIVKITGSLNSSGSVFFPALSTTSQNNVLTYDNSTGQLFYTASTAVGVVTTPGGPNKSIQFNGNGQFSGSSNLTFDSSSNKLVLSGSSDIVISGSDAGLQIFGVAGGQSILSASYIVGPTDRQMTSLFVPSGSYGQIWNLVYGPRPTHIYEIISSNGDLQFKGRIGGANPNNPYDSTSQYAFGRLGGNGIYAANLNKVLIPQGTFSGNGTGKLIVYNPDTIASQPTGFTASIDSTYELGLMAYTCSYRVGNTGEGISPNEAVFFLSNNPIIYTPSASVDYYTVFGRCTGSNGDAANPLVPSPLSASIAALSASNQPISGAANLYPVGFFMSTFESGTPVSESFVNLTPDLTASFGIPLNKIFSGSFNGGLLNSDGARTTQGTYNNDLKKLYTFISLPNNGGIPAIAEIDFDQSPPKLIAIDTGSAANANLIITYNSITKSVILRKAFQFQIFDASSSPVNWASPVATFTPANAHFYNTNALAVSNSFYAFGYSSTTDLLSVTKITSGSSGYTIQSQSYAQSYAYTLDGSSYGVSNPSFASSSNISKLITLDRSYIGPIGYSAIGGGGTNETLGVNFARAGYVYAIDTASLTTSSFYTPYIVTDANGPNNLVEFRSGTGSLLSYVDPDGTFIGPALKLVNSSSLPVGTPTTMASSGSKLFYYESGSESLHDGWVNYSPNKNVETDPTITINTDIIISTTGAVTIPEGMPVGKIFIIKGDYTTTPDITIQDGGTIDGASSYTPLGPDSAVMIVHVGGGDYRIIGGFKL